MLQKTLINQNEGGDDNEEAQITVSTNNPKTFGSGFEVIVTDVTVEEVVKGTVQDGFFNVNKLVTPLAEATAANIANADVTAMLTSVAITCGTFTGSTGTNIDFAVADPTTDIINFDTAALNIGTRFQYASTTGDLTVAGILKGTEVRVGDYLKIDSVDNAFKSLGGFDVKVIPDTGRIADVLTNTVQLQFLLGNTAERPVAGIVKDGCIRI